jgi:hypothetical protein
VTVAVLAAAAAYLWWGWCVFPLSDWNEVRLAPAFALRHGLTVYAPAGGGPLSTWIYGPLPLVLNLPATLAPDPATAVLVAGALNLLVLVAPLALVGGTAGALRTLPYWARGCALALAVLLLPGGSLAFQVADQTAIAAGLVASWCLVRAPAGPGARALAAAALACTLSIAAKQVSVFLAAAHVFYLFRYVGGAAARRYLGWLTLFGLAVAAVCLGAFGFGPLWLNLVEIPGRLPWGDAGAKLALRWPQLCLELLVPLLALTLWRRSARWPGVDTELGRSVRCAYLAYGAMLPIGLLAFFKIGGDTNVLHSWFYVMPVLVIAAVAHGFSHPSGGRWLALGCAAAIGLHANRLTQLPDRPLTQALKQATQLARFAPGTLWFPNNPVVTFYSDGKLYHVEDGLATRHLAGFDVREAEFRRGLPSPLAAVVYPAANPSPFALQLLRDYHVVTRVNHWAMYQRPEPAPR